MILKDIGTAALSEQDLTDLNAAKNRMTTVYNNGRICPSSKRDCNLATEGLTLDPEIELLMASSNNFDELQWTWEQWHEKSGKLMKDDYQIYVDFMNKAAVANGTCTKNLFVWKLIPNSLLRPCGCWSRLESKI